MCSPPARQPSRSIDLPGRDTDRRRNGLSPGLADLSAAATIALVLGCVALLAGCASWTDRRGDDAEPLVRVSSGRESADPSHPALRPVRDRPDAIVLEIECLTIPIDTEPAPADDSISGKPHAEIPHAESGAADSAVSLWQWVDESAIAFDVRRRYQANGLRVGRLIREDRFRSEIAERQRAGRDVVDEFLGEAEVASPLAQCEQRVPMRFGRRYELALHQPHRGEHVALVRVDEATVGRTLLEPQFVLALTVNGGDDPNEVLLDVEPEIQHGAMKQSFVSSGSAIRIDTRRETWPLEPLQFRTELVEGGTLVISPTAARLGLGEQMLTARSPQRGEEQLVIAIRLAKVPSLIDRR